jgi:MoaA/NifB/PqqE/SkfB family radical SAM enzyme
MKLTIRLGRYARIARLFARTLRDPGRPILAHIIPMRRCNLSCAYCNEYDGTSQPVALERLLRWVDRLGYLGTGVVTISGGEPLMHPDLDDVIARIRERGMMATLITNGYYLSPDRIERLNAVGLDHLQISIDNVEPDHVSTKSLRLLEPKLRWLAEGRQFTVTINSVLGSGVRDPEDALTIVHRARELGFTTSLGIVHDHKGQLRPLGEREMAIFREINALAPKVGPHFWNARFQSNLALGLPNEWSCRAGARYLYVDEFGLVNYCSQQRGVPGIPLEEYTRAHVQREYHTKKACAPYCTVNCVQQVGLFDNWRSPQTLVARLPARPVAPDPLGAGTPRPAASNGALIG